MTPSHGDLLDETTDATRAGIRATPSSALRHAPCKHELRSRLILRTAVVLRPLRDWNVHRDSTFHPLNYDPPLTAARTDHQCEEYGL